MSGAYGRVIKRALDVTLASVMTVVSAPVWILVAIAIKFTSRGPVLFTQQRWGRSGRHISIYKFRSMAHERAGTQVVQAIENDTRVTRVGKLLRATGLDELPQLINILRGDMSFVGPRPLAIGETVEISPGTRMSYEEVPGFTRRCEVRPGLTGLATIYLARDAPPADKFAYDLRYVEECSLTLDLKLIAMSFWISLRGRWETRASKI